MIANYGYQDGSGAYFITIDTDRCVECEGRWCVRACPRGLFAIEVDDYDDQVAVIVAGSRKKLREACASCKPASGWETLPCLDACRPRALSHSW